MKQNKHYLNFLPSFLKITFIPFCELFVLCPIEIAWELIISPGENYWKKCQYIGVCVRVESGVMGFGTSRARGINDTESLIGSVVEWQVNKDHPSSFEPQKKGPYTPLCSSQRHSRINLHSAAVIDLYRPPYLHLFANVFAHQRISLKLQHFSFEISPPFILFRVIDFFHNM